MVTEGCQDGPEPLDLTFKPVEPASEPTQPSSHSPTSIGTHNVSNSVSPQSPGVEVATAGSTHGRYDNLKSSVGQQDTLQQERSFRRPNTSWPELALAFVKQRIHEEMASDANDLQRSYGPRTILGIPLIPGGKNAAADGSQSVFSNTCALDNTMMILSFLYEHDGSFRSFLHMDDIAEKIRIRTCLRLIRDHKFNMARRVWVESLLQREVLLAPKENNISGSEFEVGISPLSALFRGYCEHMECLLHGDNTIVRRSPLGVKTDSVEATVLYLNGGHSMK